MGRARSIVAGLAGAALAAAAASPAPGQPEDVGAEVPMIARGAPVSQQDENTAAGRPVVLFHYVHIDRACGPSAIAIRLTTPPTHGTVAIEDGEERPWSGGRPMFAPGDPRAHCGNSLAATKDALYTPAPGFTGHDTVVVEFTEDGTTFTDAIEVSVW
ncbi:MAG TPA: hypothetical protein VGL58_16760 [Caulobacteraceae bacterium]|jgi:hypothetical protein